MSGGCSVYVCVHLCIHSYITQLMYIHIHNILTIYNIQTVCVSLTDKHSRLIHTCGAVTHNHKTCLLVLDFTNSCHCVRRS